MMELSMAGKLDFSKSIKKQRQKIEKLLTKVLDKQTNCSPRELKQAMNYAVLGGGKRFRAMLIYAAGEAVGVANKYLSSSACAIELVHAFSLVHDDLPAMDNSNTRRGRPTCHIKFGEDVAILAGDALMVAAFHAITDDRLLDAAQKLSLINLLIKASGVDGIAGGQYLDIRPQKPSLPKDLKKMYSLKTGALLKASIEMGIAMGAVSKNKRLLFREIGLLAGIAFQIKDDLADLEGSAEELGKDVGVDGLRDRITYPRLKGIKAAKLELAKVKKQLTKILAQLKLPIDSELVRLLGEIVGL